MSSPSNLYALLIGVGCYLSGSKYYSLSGTVPAINLVDGFLQKRLKLPQKNIVRLTSTNLGSLNPEPPEPREQWPTYENMVRAFKEIAKSAKKGDQIYIHYAGHGGRVPTRFPKLKGKGRDETLVPLNIGDRNARHLRDVELAYLLKKMVEKELIVTVVLDSCHSGGASRGVGGAVSLGVKDPDNTQRPQNSDVATGKQLEENWRDLSAADTSLELGSDQSSGWLPYPRGYVLLAACTATEEAMEIPIDGGKKMSVLTYCLLELLKQLREGQTYKMLHDRLVHMVRTLTSPSKQTPTLEGDVSRVVFGADRAQPLYSVSVIDTNLPEKRLLLKDAGAIHGLGEGAKFEIYPQLFDISKKTSPLAVVEIKKLDSVDSWAVIAEQTRRAIIKPGFQAVLLEPGKIRIGRTMGIFKRDDVPSSIDQDKLLTEVKKVLERSKNGFVALAEKDEPPEYQVTINADGAYEIWNRAGEPYPNLYPSIKVGSGDAAELVVQRVVHLAKYRNIKELDNMDPKSQLVDLLELEMMGMQQDYRRGDKMRTHQLKERGNIPILKVGERFCLRMKNRAKTALNVAMLDLAPDYSIRQIYPKAQDTKEFDVGHEEFLTLRATFASDDINEGTDTLKVFATVQPTSFRWLELPALDKPRERTRGPIRSPANPLEELFDALMWERPRTRDPSLPTPPTTSVDWSVGQLDIHIRKTLDS